MADGAQPIVAVEVTAVAVELPSLDTRIEWYEDWEENTATAQALSRRDRRYVDHEQWTDEEKRILKRRKQPILTKNRIHQKVEFILGEIIKRRTDPNALPRTPAHEDDAVVATDALRFVEDEQGADKVQAEVARNMLVEGYGGAIKEIEQTEDDSGKPDAVHKLRHVEWDRLFYDPKSRARDFSDAKYLGIVLWMDLDDAIDLYPDAADTLEQAVVAAGQDDSLTSTTEDTPRGWIDGKRKRVKISEMYFRVGDDWYRADFTKVADLRQPQLTWYLDDTGKRHLCPLLMQSCYVDANGSRYGIVRGLISPQDEINKRSSKALHLLNTKQVLAEQDAIPDPNKFQSELAKPDGLPLVGPGRMTDGSVKLLDNNADLMGHVQLLQEAKLEIDEIGPSAAMISTGPGTSGREVVARQQAASMGLGTFFDGVDDWTLRLYKLDWCCIRWSWTEEKWLRVRDDQELKGHRFVAINRRMTRAQRLQELMQKQPPPSLPDAVSIAAGHFAPIVLAIVQQQAQQMQQQAQILAQQTGQEPQQPDLSQLIASHPLMQEIITTNQVAKMGVDIIIDKAPDTAVIEQEEFGKLSEVAGTIIQTKPEMAPMVGKMVLKASQLRNKRELLEEWDKGPTPEQQQQQQAAQQMQMQQMQMQIQLTQTQLDLTQAQTQLTLAKAQSEQARIAQAMADAEQTQAQTAAVPSEIELNRARALDAAASAGAKTVPTQQGAFP